MVHLWRPARNCRLSLCWRVAFPDCLSLPVSTPNYKENLTSFVRQLAPVTVSCSPLKSVMRGRSWRTFHPFFSANQLSGRKGKVPLELIPRQNLPSLTSIEASCLPNLVWCTIIIIIIIEIACPQCELLPISEVPGHVYTCAVDGVSGNETHDSGNDVSLCVYTLLFVTVMATNSLLCT